LAALLKLPKDVVADPHHDALVTLLSARSARLWENGRNQVATVPMTRALAAELCAALVEGHACQGLELSAERLRSEQEGLDALSKKAPGSPQNARASRVLFLANDGSTRFYGDSDALLSKYQQRMLGCRLAVAGKEPGNALLGAPRMVHSVLVVDKKVAAKALLALLPQG
jgi:hypothetical protein